MRPGRQDERKAARILERNRRVSVAFHASRTAQDQPFDQNRFGVDVRREDRAGNECQIGAAAFYQPGEIDAHAFVNSQRNFRKFLTDSKHQRSGDELRHRRCENDSDFPARRLAEVFDIVFRALDLPKYRARMLVEQGARGRTRDAARRAFEQRHIQFLFQLGDLLAQRRLRDPQFLRRTGQAARLDDRLKVRELVNLHRRPSHHRPRISNDIRLTYNDYTDIVFSKIGPSGLLSRVHNQEKTVPSRDRKI